MILEIRNYLAASHLLETQSGEWAAIVILDSDSTATDFIQRHTVDHLLLRFDDITAPRHGRRMADVRSLQAALQFAEGREKLVVSYRAGQSRSAAVAHAISFQYNGADAAKQLLNPQRHSPNRLMVETMASLLDDPLYLSAFDDSSPGWSRVVVAVYWGGLGVCVEFIMTHLTVGSRRSAN